MRIHVCIDGWDIEADTDSPDMGVLFEAFAVECENQALQLEESARLLREHGATARRVAQGAFPPTETKP